MIRRTSNWAGASACALVVGIFALPLYTAAQEVAAVPPQPTRITSRRYRDGIYSATGQYGNLPSHLTVTVELHDDIITSVVVKTHATNPISLDYQRRFAAAVPAVVVGKLLSDVRVGRLAGSSGCPDGFNDAVARIRAQAAR
jgi:uncharacterized protein with FMN-binding domain